MLTGKCHLGDDLQFSAEAGRLVRGKGDSRSRWSMKPVALIFCFEFLLAFLGDVRFKRIRVLMGSQEIGDAGGQGPNRT